MKIMTIAFEVYVETRAGKIDLPRTNVRENLVRIRSETRNSNRNKLRRNALVRNLLKSKSHYPRESLNKNIYLSNSNYETPSS